MTPGKILFALTLLMSCRTTPAVAPYAPPPPAPIATALPDFASSPNVAIVATAGGTAETSIAISPADPNRVVVAGAGPTPGRFRRSEAYVSTDGGRTWSAKRPYPETINGMTFAGGGDPVVTVDREGRFYFTSLLVGVTPSRSGVAVARSDDGLTWNEPVIVSLHTGNVRPYDDKQWIVADDTGGPHDGNVYLIWGRYAQVSRPDPGQIVIARSTDGGATWSEPVALSVNGSVGLSELEIGPAGEVYATYYENARGFLLRTSRDGGVTFDAPRLIGPPLGGGGQMPNVQAQFRPMQSFAVDRSPGPYRGTLYYLMPSRSGAAGAISLMRSTDGGESWSAPQNISGDTKGRDAALPSISVDNVSGEVLAAWIDRRDDAANVVARLYASRSADGGTTWSEPKPFSAPFSIDAPFIGDYNGAAAHAGNWVAAFSDAGGYMSVARIDLGQAKPRSGPRRGSVRVP